MTELQEVALAQIKQLQDFALMMATVGEYIQSEAEDAIRLAEKIGEQDKEAK